MALSNEESLVVEKLRARALAAEQEKLTKAEEEKRFKIAVNALLEANGEPPEFSLDESAGPTGSFGAPQAYAPTEFFQKQLAPCVRRILTDHGASTIDTIFDKLREGGFEFDRGKKVEDLRNGLKISIGKTVGFSKAPNGFYVVGDAKRRQRSDAKPQVSDSPVPEQSAAEDAAGGADA